MVCQDDKSQHVLVHVDIDNKRISPIGASAGTMEWPKNPLTTTLSNGLLADLDHHKSTANVLKSPTVFQAAAAAHFKVYPSRFLMLGIFSFLSFTNAMMWITFAPVSDEAMDFYGIGAFGLNALSLVYMVVYLPFAFYAADVIDRRSLRSGLLIGTGLNVAGAVIRILPYPFTTSDKGMNYGFVMTGQFFASVAQTFILSTPPKIAQNWFPPQERVSATSAGALFNQLGIAFGFFLSPLVLNKDSARFPYLMIVQAGICLLAGALVSAFMRSTPPSPPSLSAEEREQAEPTVVVLRKLMGDPTYVCLLISFGIAVGVFYCISTLLGQILDVSHYSSTVAGNFGVVMLLSGILGLVIAGWLADRVKVYHKHIYMVSVGGMAASIVWFALVNKPGQLYMLAVCAGVMGFFMTSLLPVALDMAVEVAFPQPETVACTALFLSAQVFGIVFVGIFSILHGRLLVDSANWSMVGASAVAALLMVPCRVRYNRLEKEKAGQSDHSLPTPTTAGTLVALSPQSV